MKTTEEFYNDYNFKLLEDYVTGNRRLEMAITTLGKYIPVNSKRILDIGCGIGWSSYEVANYLQEAQVEGIDLSPVLIQTAKKIFKKNNLSFSRNDLYDGLPSKLYDAILMLDVYEHISLDFRSDFHQMLKKSLKKNSRILLSCPTTHHQNWVRSNNPLGLQPIDEDVDLECINQLAKDLNGEVIYFEYQRIWQAFDYLYAVIEISPDYGNQSILNFEPINIENEKSRRLRAKENLNLKFPKEKMSFKQWLFPTYRKLKKSLGI